MNFLSLLVFVPSEAANNPTNNPFGAGMWANHTMGTRESKAKSDEESVAFLEVPFGGHV